MSAPPQFISPYILRSEFACSCCGQLPFDYDENNPLPAFAALFIAFAGIRTAWGRPIPINSGYRCPAHNAAVKGGPLSAHLFGLALDLAVTSPEELIALKNTIISTRPLLRVGWIRYLAAGRNLEHIDTAYLVRPRPTAAFIEGMRW